MRNANRFGPLLNAIRHSLTALSLLAMTAVHADQLTVIVENVQSDEGNLMIAIGDESSFTTPEGAEPTEHAVQIILPARSGSVSFSTDVLPAGDYAVTVFHDENGNSELDANFVGMPKEPWGFSNNARGNFGPPKFADTKFALDGETKVVLRVEK